MSIRYPMTGIVVALLIPSGIALAQSVNQLSWLAGCWRRATATHTTVEQWTRPRGGMMLGLSHTVRDGRTRGFEFLRIVERDGPLIYAAQPSGQAVNQFTAVEVTDSTLIVHDPTHDFPQRIGYRRAGVDSILAWIDGETDRGPRRVEFHFRRAGCP